jgi:hypothetical protein
MSTFKAKRVSGAELAAQISPATAHLPAATPAGAVAVTQEPASKPAEAPRVRAAKTVQVNFKASEAFADLLAQEAVKAGSTRRFLARLMRDAGYAVPEADLNPPETRRRGVGLSGPASATEA